MTTTLHSSSTPHSHSGRYSVSSITPIFSCGCRHQPTRVEALCDTSVTRNSAPEAIALAFDEATSVAVFAFYDALSRELITFIFRPVLEPTAPLDIEVHLVENFDLKPDIPIENGDLIVTMLPESMSDYSSFIYFILFYSFLSL